MAFPITLAAPPAFPGPLPASADVVVIGGGVVGVSAALFLRRRGLSVVLVEKGRVAAEQSSRNWGWIRQQGRDPAELPLMVEARRLWQQLAAEIAAATGADIGLVEGGVAYLARGARDMAAFADWLPHATALGIDTRLLDARAAAALLPGASPPFAGALVTPSDMRAEPWVAVPALAALAAREGVTIVEGCAARRLDRAGGRVTGVVTEAGRVAASSVVLAGGAWSALFLRAHGVALPQLSVRATVAATEPLPVVWSGGAADDRIAFRPRQDGGYTIAVGGSHDLFIGPDAFRALPKFLPQLRADPFGTRFRLAAPAGWPDAWRTPRAWEADTESPFERLRILSPAPDAATVERARRRFEALYPGLGPVRIRTAWAGMIDTMPDLVPVIDACAALPGLVIGTGLSGHGFGIGPGVGRVLAALVTGEAPGHDLARFRLARFSDGSPIRLGPSL